VLQLAQQALRDSGVAGNDLAILMNEWSELLRQRVKKGGRAAWGGPLKECAAEVANEHLSQLAAGDPELAMATNEWLALARRKVAKGAKGQGLVIS
jgi:hypothetical protein